MRSDPGKSQGFKYNKLWGETEVKLFERATGADSDGPAFRTTAFSGNERNRLFLRRDNNFEDVSLISGVDFREDGRGFVVFDYDRDGWQDLGVTSPNFPRFRVVKNQMGERSSVANFVEVNLMGGQTSAEPSTEWSNRDAFGATILAKIGDTSRMFQLSASEGLSSQNTHWIHIGLGEAKQVDSLKVMWPSGRTSIRQNIAAGERITISESERDDGEVGPSSRASLK